MTEYQVIARKYRPQRFSDVVGQLPLVTTLTNAIKYNRLAQAYLFCGTRGTGKTSIARIFAKALNCQNLGPDFEPCNTCSSCKEITAGNSLDVLEIDGASHRGIDDIRQINETVGFTPTSGKFKIYLIDEVHMLTKEAFNALLKTLEEPPSNVKFFFATTEPHKVPATILSRCQRFQLKRITIEEISEKLRLIAKNLNRDVDDAAIYLIAKLAEGSLRDAESLYDQVLSYHEGKIDADMAANMLGFAPSKSFFSLDEAVKKGHLAYAFELTNQLFIDGKDLYYFVDMLIEHFRNILTSQLDPKGISGAHIDRNLYIESAKIYTQDETLNLLEYLLNARQEMKNALSPQIALESILLHIIHCKKRLSIESLVDKLLIIEKNILALPDEFKDSSTEEKKKPYLIEEENSSLKKQTEPLPLEPIDTIPTTTKQEITQACLLKETPLHHKKESSKQKVTPPALPNPKNEEIKEELKPKDLQKSTKEISPPPKPIALSKKDETLMRFASVELEGTLKINSTR